MGSPMTPGAAEGAATAKAGGAFNSTGAIGWLSGDITGATAASPAETSGSGETVTTPASAVVGAPAGANVNTSALVTKEIEAIILVLLLVPV
jgi:hypothetical protein